MRLLLDENLSYRLVALLADAFPGSTHVRDAGLSGAPDDAVWDHARAHGLAVVSKDSDFRDRALLHGPPPRLVWIRRGNCSTRDIAALLLRRRADLERFAADPEASVLELG